MKSTRRNKFCLSHFSCPTDVTSSESYCLNGKNERRQVKYPSGKLRFSPEQWNTLVSEMKNLYRRMLNMTRLSEGWMSQMTLTDRVKTRILSDKCSMKNRIVPNELHKNIFLVNLKVVRLQPIPKKGSKVRPQNRN